MTECDQIALKHKYSHTNAEMFTNGERFVDAQSSVCK